MQGVSDLPAKVIQEISDRLSPRDVCNALEVCTAWNQAFGSSVRCLSPFRLEGTGLLQRFPKLQRLDLARITGNVAERDLHQLSQLCCLDYLSLRGCSSISCLAFLATLTGLQQLDLRQCRLLKAGALRNLLRCCSLQELLCDGCTSLGPEDLASIALLTKLTELSLSSCQWVCGGDISILAGLPRLCRLRLCCLRQLSDAAFASLAAAPYLQSLRVDWCPLFRGAFFGHQTGFISLQLLSAIDCQALTDISLVELAQLPLLTALIMDECRLITDEGIANLASATRLQQLSMRGCTFTGEGLAALVPSVRLCVLKLSMCTNLSRQGALAIARQAWLEELSLAQVDWVDDAFVRCLGSLSRLKTLNLSYCPNVTYHSFQMFPTTFPLLSKLVLSNCKSLMDEAAGEFCRLQHLLELDLSCCALTDAAAACLHDRLPNLTFLNVAGSLISEAGARHLRSVPHLNIRACEAVATDVQLQHSPIQFDHLHMALTSAC